MDESKIKSVLNRASDALERSSHFRRGNKVYQEFLAREAAEKELKFHSHEKKEENIKQNADELQTLHETRLRNALAEHAQLVQSQVKQKQKKNPRSKNSMKSPLTLTSVQRLEKLYKLNEKTPSFSHGGDCEQMSQEKQPMTPNQALGYVNSKQSGFTVRNLRQIMDKTRESNKNETSSDTPGLNRRLRAASFSTLRAAYSQDSYTRLASLGLKSYSPISSPLNSLEGKPDPNSRPLSLEPNYNVSARNLAEPINISRGSSPIRSRVTPSEPFIRSAAYTRTSGSLANLTTKVKAKTATSVSGSIKIKPKPIPAVGPSPKLALALESIINDLKTMGNGTGISNLYKEESFEHLAKIRPQKLTGKTSKRRFPPGIQAKAESSATSYFGFPYFTKNGVIIDSQTQSEYPSKSYPKAEFKNEFNMSDAFDLPLLMNDARSSLKKYDEYENMARASNAITSYPITKRK